MPPAHHDAGHVVVTRPAQHLADDVLALQDHGLAAQLLGQPQRLRHLILRFLAQIGVAVRLDVDGGPGRARPVGNTLGGAYDPGGGGVGADADEDAVACRPRPGDGMRPHVVEHLRIDALGRVRAAPVRAGPSGCRGEKKLCDRPPRPARARRPCLRASRFSRSSGGRSISSISSARSQDAVRQRFAHLDAGDALDDVVQALQVLDVERRVDVDAGGEDLVHVLPALEMPAAGRRWCGPARRPARCSGGGRGWRRCPSRERAAAVVDVRRGNDLQAGEQRLRFLRPCVSTIADDHVDAFAPALLGRLPAWRRSCRRRGRRRGRSSARRGVRGSPPRAAPPAMDVYDLRDQPSVRDP